MRRFMLMLALLLTAFQALPQEARLAPHARLQTAARARLTALAFPSGGSSLLAGDEEGNVSSMDLERKVQLGSCRLEEAPIFLAGATDGRGCLAVGESGTVTMVDLLKETAAPSFRTKGKPLRVALDAGMRYLAVATEDETVELFDVKAMLPAGVISATDKLDGALQLGPQPRQRRRSIDALVCETAKEFRRGVNGFP